MDIKGAPERIGNIFDSLGAFLLGLLEVVLWLAVAGAVVYAAIFIVSKVDEGLRSLPISFALPAIGLGLFTATVLAYVLASWWLVLVGLLALAAGLYVAVNGDQRTYR